VGGIEVGIGSDVVTAQAPRMKGKQRRIWIFFVHGSPLLAIVYPALKKIGKHPKSIIMASDVSIGSRSK
jgi:hypothetical protein